jgi:hypothetical protein
MNKSYKFARKKKISAKKKISSTSKYKYINCKCTYFFEITVGKKTMARVHKLLIVEIA